MRRVVGEERAVPEVSSLVPELVVRWRGETIRLAFEAEPHARRERLVEVVRLLPRLLADLAVTKAAVEQNSVKGRNTDWFNFRLRDVQGEIGRVMDELRALVTPSPDN